MQPGDVSREELGKLPVWVQYTCLLRPHFVRSESSRCDHSECSCADKFKCPLCPFETTESLAVAESHYECMHWNRRMEIAGSPFTIFSCGEPHEYSTRRKTMVGGDAVSSPRSSACGPHWHCPYCAFRDSSEQFPIEHVRTVHADKLVLAPRINDVAHSVKDSIASIRREEGGMTSGDAFTVNRKLKFSNVVRLRSFPLAVSIVDQAGGMRESRKEKFCLEKFVDLELVKSALVFDDNVTYSGCDLPKTSLFKGIVFLLCGVNAPLSIVSAITSLKGEVSGARYDDSSEWARITHVLLGKKVSSKSVKEIKKFLRNDVLWVSSDWVKVCVQHGTIYGAQQLLGSHVFPPYIIERYFAIQQAADRLDRRKSVRYVHTVEEPLVGVGSSSSSSSSSTPRFSPPVLEVQDRIVERFTPPVQPEFVLQPQVIVQPPMVVQPAMIVQPPTIVPPTVPAPIIETTPSSEPFLLRRSKRQSVAPVRFNPAVLNSFNHPYHNTIKKA